MIMTVRKATTPGFEIVLPRPCRLNLISFHPPLSGGSNCYEMAQISNKPTFDPKTSEHNY